MVMEVGPVSRSAARYGKRGMGSVISLWLEKKAWLVFLAPAVIILLSITVFPMFYSLLLAFHDWNMGSWAGWRFIGLENFKMIFRHDVFFRTSVVVTILFVTGTVGAQFILGMGIALLLNRELRKPGLVRTILILPTMMTPVVVGLIWRFMYNPELGIMNYLLNLMGISSRNWLGDLKTALLSVMFADTWEWTPFMALVILAGLHALPREPFEAASIDGASSWAVFRYITLPLAKPTILVAVLIRLMDAFKAFDLVFVLTKGGPGMATEVLSFYTYRTGFKFFHMGYAAALSYVMLLIIVIISQVFIRLLAREEVGR